MWYSNCKKINDKKYYEKLRVTKETRIIAAAFPLEAIKERKWWNKIFKELSKNNNIKPIFLYSVNYLFKCKEEIKTFSDKQSLQERIKAAFQE